MSSRGQGVHGVGHVGFTRGNSPTLEVQRRVASVNDNAKDNPVGCPGTAPSAPDRPEGPVPPGGTPRSDAIGAVYEAGNQLNSGSEVRSKPLAKWSNHRFPDYQRFTCQIGSGSG